MTEQIVDLMEANMPGPRGATGPQGPQGLPGVDAVPADEAVARTFWVIRPPSRRWPA